MSPETRRGAARRACDPEQELSVLVTRIPSPEDQEPLTEDELDAFEYVDPALDFRIRRQHAPWLGRALSTFHDMNGPRAVDIGVGEPLDGCAWGGFFTIGASTGASAPASGGSAPGLGPSPSPGQGQGQGQGPAPSTSASPHAAAAPEPPCVRDPRTGRLRRPRRVEFHVRVPTSEFHYFDGEILEPFDDIWDTVMYVLGELGRLQHTRGPLYRASQIVTTPDLAPFVKGLPFAGAWLRDGADGGLLLQPLRVSRRETIDFLPVTFLHPSEVRALLGPDRVRAAAQLDAAGIDALTRPKRRPVL